MLRSSCLLALTVAAYTNTLRLCTLIPNAYILRPYVNLRMMAINSAVPAQFSTALSAHPPQVRHTCNCEASFIPWRMIFICVARYKDCIWYYGLVLPQDFTFEIVIPWLLVLLFCTMIYTISN